MRHPWFCQFCWRAATETVAWTIGNHGREVRCCEKHRNDANDLAYGYAARMNHYQSASRGRADHDHN